MNEVFAPHPLRIQRKRTKGFRLPEGAICVTRPGKWGNPFTRSQAVEVGYATSDSAGQFCVDCFRDWLSKGELSEWWFDLGAERWEWMRANLDKIRGKTLACFCPLTQPCHGDVLAELANGSRRIGDLWL